MVFGFFCKALCPAPSIGRRQAPHVLRPPGRPQRRGGRTQRRRGGPLPGAGAREGCPNRRPDVYRGRPIQSRPPLQHGAPGRIRAPRRGRACGHGGLRRPAPRHAGNELARTCSLVVRAGRENLKARTTGRQATLEVPRGRVHIIRIAARHPAAQRSSTGCKSP